MKIKTLGKIAIGLSLSVAGMAFLLQNKIKRNFYEQTYYREAVDLVKGYKPAMERLGEPIKLNKIDLTDPFNYQDKERARVKIPITGENSSADVFVYAIRIQDMWNIQTMELKYRNCEKFKFYERKLAKKDN